MLSVDKLKFDKTANHAEIVDAIKNRLEAQKLSSNAWIVADWWKSVRKKTKQTHKATLHRVAFIMQEHL